MSSKTLSEILKIEQISDLVADLRDFVQDEETCDEAVKEILSADKHPVILTALLQTHGTLLSEPFFRQIENIEKITGAIVQFCPQWTLSRSFIDGILHSRTDALIQSLVEYRSGELTESDYDFCFSEYGTSVKSSIVRTTRFLNEDRSMTYSTYPNISVRIQAVQRTEIRKNPSLWKSFMTDENYAIRYLFADKNDCDLPLELLILGSLDDNPDVAQKWIPKRAKKEAESLLAAKMNETARPLRGHI